MSFGATCLLAIVKESFKGRKKNLADAAKVRANVITKLTSGQNFTSSTLSSICEALSDSQARNLCAAVCRDIIPEKFQSILDVTKNENDFDFSMLDEDTKKIILHLATQSARDPETRDWLKQLSTWMLGK